MPITRARLGLQPRPAAKSGANRRASVERNGIIFLQKRGYFKSSADNQMKNKINNIYFK